LEVKSSQSYSPFLGYFKIMFGTSKSSPSSEIVPNLVALFLARDLYHKTFYRLYMIGAPYGTTIEG
jgi:hypothetical protein